MEITIYSKQRQGKDGRKFTAYLTRLTNKRTGDVVPAQVRFDTACEPPKTYPTNIIIDNGEGNISTRQYVREDNGELKTSYTLWVKRWHEGTPYVDHSLDDFM